MPSTRTKADIEYSVMLTVLNFQREFMQSHYSHIQVRLLGAVIEVDLTRTAPIPAEKQLAKTREGCAQLKHIHRALFIAGQDILTKQLEELLGVNIREIVTDLEPLSGRNTIVIRLNETIGISP
ncbi:MAG: DUF2294 domain-containing protein [Nitrospira sp.]|nr:DUF2294 domain-containing protein [Nitrospira sp.]